MNVELLKQYKKQIVIAIVIVFIAIVFVLKGSSTKGICDVCGQYEKLTKYNSENVCDDCYKYEKFLNSW